MERAGISDPSYAGLLHRAGSGLGPWTQEIAEYEWYEADMSVVNGVVTYKGRVVVPGVLRGEVLDALHRAHQELTSMSVRAGDTVWWPDLARDLERVRKGCLKCTQNAPSQPAAPPKSLPVPDYHFQLLSSDYFHYSGKL